MKKSLVSDAARSPAADQQEWLRRRSASRGAGRARKETFPVASRLLRATTRRDLLDIYVLARLIDDVGDEAPGDRTALLDLLDADISRLALGDPTLAPVAALVPAVRQRNLPVNAFHDLVAAN